MFPKRKPARAIAKAIPMKDRSIHWTLMFLAMLLAATLFAQGKGKGKTNETRDPALGWYLPVKGQVYEAGQKAKGFTVEVFRDNRSEKKLPIGKKGDFVADLDLDNLYTLKISKPGFQDKWIQVDTSIPQEKMAYPPYALMVNLEPETGLRPSDDLFSDFPSAIVRFNAELGGFFHSEEYLANIHTRWGSTVQAKP